MRFSIIVPVYNVEAYIGECLQSIEDQEFHDYELIVVVDETSKDKSSLIVQNYRERYKNIIVLPQGHYGLGSARNYGMQYASGDYLIFLDSDDKFGVSHYLQDMERAIVSTSPDFVISRSMKYVGNIGGEVGIPWGSDITENSKPRDALIKVINSGYFGISAWAKAIRKSFVRENNLQFVDGYSEDFDWTSQIINLTDKYAFVNTPGVIHYIRSGSLSGDHNRKQVDDLGKRIEKWAALISDKSDFEKSQLGYLAYSYYIYIADIHFVGKKDQKQLWEREKKLRFLRKYGVSNKCKYSNIVCTLFGVRLGSLFLHEYIKRKKSSEGKGKKNE